MTSRFEPADTLVGPIIHQLAVRIQDQIGGVGRLYETPPDGPPESGGVLFPYTIESDDNTTGKLGLRIKFSIHHVFRRSNYADNYAAAQSYVVPWLLFWANWSNQTLNGLTTGVHPSRVGVIQFVSAQTPYLAVVSSVEVTTQLNVPIS